MKIINLFDSYKQFTENSETIFSDSGMVNEFGKLDYGFFPLGSGILTERSKIEIAEIKKGGIMVLGNDFGTIGYVEKMKNNREYNSKTIKNLERIGLDIDNTFFTNFYMGLRNDKLHSGTTNTKRIKQIEQSYKNLCYDFFLTQLEHINPKIVICLGKEVGQALSQHASEVFSKFSLNKTGITKIFADTTNDNYTINTSDNIFGKRKFILIPHPSYAHINWSKNDIEEKIKLEIID